MIGRQVIWIHIADVWKNSEECCDFYSSSCSFYTVTHFYLPHEPELRPIFSKRPGLFKNTNTCCFFYNKHFPSPLSSHKLLFFFPVRVQLHVTSSRCRLQSSCFHYMLPAFQGHFKKMPIFLTKKETSQNRKTMTLSQILDLYFRI